VQAAFGGGDWYSQPVRRLFGGEAGDIAQDQDFAVGRWKGCNRARYVDPQIRIHTRCQRILGIQVQYPCALAREPHAFAADNLEEPYRKCMKELKARIRR
jgi:hypothetical protein